MEMLLPAMTYGIFWFILAEPDWPLRIGTYWRLFLIGLFKREFMPPVTELLSSLYGCIGTLPVGLWALPSREAARLGLDLICLELSMVLPGEFERRPDCELSLYWLVTMEMDPCFGGETTFCLCLPELERLSTTSLSPVMTFAGTIGAPPIAACIAAAMPALRFYGRLCDE